MRIFAQQILQMSDALGSEFGHARMGSARPRKGCGKKAEMEKTVKGEAAVGIQAEAAGGHASQGIGQISAIGAALHNLVRLRIRKKTAAEASAETERVRRPGQGMARSHMDAGIIRGLSLFLDNPNARRRR
jgi:hypothetical protein